MINRMKRLVKLFEDAPRYEVPAIVKRIENLIGSCEQNIIDSKNEGTEIGNEYDFMNNDLEGLTSWQDRDDIEEYLTIHNI